MTRKWLGKLFLSAILFVAIAGSAQAQGKPNIVFILLDNVGWGDLGVYGGVTPTPRIDQLANEGIRFNNYNVEAQCTPTRSAIMTGRYAVRSGTFRVPLPGEPGKAGLAPWEYTLPKLLSDAGYATALYGKWHLGDTEGRLPNNMGFDEWWGIKNTWDEAGYTSYPLFKETGGDTPMIWEGKKGEPSKPVMPLDLNVRPFVDGKYIVPKTIDFIASNAAKSKPFFVYVSYSEMHPPLGIDPQFDRTSPRRGGLYSDLIGEMDFRVGQILDAIKQAGVDNDTIVIVSSDNGTGGVDAGGGGSNGPWRGNFMTPPFEGSMRTLAMVRWPGKVRAGVVTQEILAVHDWLPTLADLAGASDRVPKDRPIDGVDAAPFMLGNKNTTARDTYVSFGPDGSLMSVKWKIYKTILRYSDGIDKPIVTPQFPMLYDLSSDPHENFNLFRTKLDNGWIFGTAFKAIGLYQRSLSQYPNIRTGEEFTGYLRN